MVDKGVSLLLHQTVNKRNRFWNKLMPIANKSGQYFDVQFPALKREFAPKKLSLYEMAKYNINNLATWSH